MNKKKKCKLCKKRFTELIKDTCKRCHSKLKTLNGELEIIDPFELIRKIK